MQKKASFSSFPVLIAILVANQIMCFMYARRQIDFFNLPINVSGIIFPIEIYIVEIIGECFSYEHSRQAVWINTFIHIFYIACVSIIALIPYSSFMHTDIAFSYHHLIDISWIVALGSLIGTFLGDMFSARFVTQTKVILNGNYTFLRLFLSQLISEMIVTSSYLLSFLTNNYTLNQTLKLIVCTIFIKSIIAILLWPLARIIINKIKFSEGFEGFDFKQDYKTLAFAINNEKIYLKGVYNVK